MYIQAPFFIYLFFLVKTQGQNTPPPNTTQINNIWERKSQNRLLQEQGKQKKVKRQRKYN